MDELIRENQELEQQPEELAEEELLDVTEESADEDELLFDEDDEDAMFAAFQDPEQFDAPDEIFFTSDFVLTAEDFKETAEYAYLIVAKNSWILCGLVAVFALSCIISGNTDYLKFLPIVALALMLTQVRRYSNTDKDISKAYNLMQSKTNTGDMHYHIEFGEFMHITNNDRATPRRDINEIRSICETEKYYLLCLDQQLYVPVAKNSISGDETEFFAYLRKCCRDLKRKKISRITGVKKRASWGVIAFVIVTVITLAATYFMTYK